MYDIYIYTASVKEYADIVLERIDPKMTLFQKRFYREHCDKRDEKFYKSLKRIGADLKRTVFIDNSLISILNDFDNSYLISSYEGNQNDSELLKYLHKLRKFANDKRDIRT